MDVITNIITWAQTPTAAIIFAALFGASEGLAAIPAVKANAVFQLITGLFGKLRTMMAKPPVA